MAERAVGMAVIRGRGRRWRPC